MWGKLLLQALNVIAGREQAPRASGHPHGLGFWIIEKKTTVYLARPVTFQRETRKLLDEEKQAFFFRIKGGLSSAQGGCTIFSEPAKVRNDG